jgi:ligand-binding SRPBCC domain-containing protein
MIHLITKIKAPVERCFDLSRSIDLHQISTTHTKEKAIAGVITGLIGLNETVTWQAKHFGLTQTMTSRITEMERPYMFVDEMVKGPFKAIKHRHAFKAQGEITIMIDDFQYSSPLGVVGRLFNYFILDKYLTRLLIDRNLVIKDYAESERWKEILN